MRSKVSHLDYWILTFSCIPASLFIIDFSPLLILTPLTGKKTLDIAITSIALLFKMRAEKSLSKITASIIYDLLLRRHAFSAAWIFLYYDCHLKFHFLFYVKLIVCSLYNENKSVDNINTYLTTFFMHWNVLKWLSICCCQYLFIFLFLSSLVGSAVIRRDATLA